MGGGAFSPPMGGLFPSVGEALLVCVGGGGGQALILPSISMWLDTHISLIRPHFLTYYFIFHVICQV